MSDCPRTSRVSESPPTKHSSLLHTGCFPAMSTAVSPAYLRRSTAPRSSSRLPSFDSGGENDPCSPSSSLSSTKSRFSRTRNSGTARLGSKPGHKDAIVPSDCTAKRCHSAGQHRSDAGEENCARTEYDFHLKAPVSRRESTTTPSSNTVDQSNDDDRCRSLSDSWPLWGTVSPLLSPSSWFEQADSFRSFSDSSRHRALSTVLTSRETRRLVRQYEATKTPSLKLHEQFKHTKWGEDAFCEFDLDTTDLSLDLPLTDTLSFLPITDTLAQCVRSYSTFLSNQLFKRRRRATLSSGAEDHGVKEPNNDDTAILDDPRALVPLQGSASSGDSDDSCTPQPIINKNHRIPRHHDSEGPAASRAMPALTPARSSPVLSTTDELDHTWLGELAVPRAVQEALDFALAVSSRAGQAIEALIPPACPKRHHSAADGAGSLPTGRSRCPRRLRKKPVVTCPEGNTTADHTVRETTYISCPRRAVRSTRCVRRARRRHKDKLKSLL